MEIMWIPYYGISFRETTNFVVQRENGLCKWNSEIRNGNHNWYWIIHHSLIAVTARRLSDFQSIVVEYRWSIAGTLLEYLQTRVFSKYLLGIFWVSPQFSLYQSVSNKMSLSGKINNQVPREVQRHNCIQSECIHLIQYGVSSVYKRRNEIANYNL